MPLFQSERHWLTKKVHTKFRMRGEIYKFILLTFPAKTISVTLSDFLKFQFIPVLINLSDPNLNIKIQGKIRIEIKGLLNVDFLIREFSKIIQMQFRQLNWQDMDFPPALVFK